MSPKDAALVSAAASTLNKFADDGSFMSKILVKQNEDAGGSVGFLYKPRGECGVVCWLRRH
jgi:hypothetical protein